MYSNSTDMCMTQGAADSSAYFDRCVQPSAPSAPFGYGGLNFLELSRLGLRERVVHADGNGLFHAVLDQMKQHSHRDHSLYAHQRQPSHSARILRDRTCEFVKRPDMKLHFPGYGSAASAAMAIGSHGYHSSGDGNMAARIIALMLDLNLVILKAGQFQQLNESAASRGMPQMTIVYDETRSEDHFNSTESA